MIVKKQYAKIETIKDVPHYDASALGVYVRHSFAVIDSSDLDGAPNRWCYCAAFVFDNNILLFTIPTNGMNNFDNVTVVNNVGQQFILDEVNSLYYIVNRDEIVPAMSQLEGTNLRTYGYNGSRWVSINVWSQADLANYTNPTWNNGDTTEGFKSWETDRFTVEIDNNGIKILYMNYPVGIIII